MAGFRSHIWLRSVLAGVVCALAVAGPGHAEQAASASRTLQAGWLDVDFDHACAVLATGAVSCWGGNTYGQVGDGTTGVNRTVAVAVPLGAGRRGRAVAGGTRHTCALLDDATIRCWGGNTFGQLGDATTTDRPSPVPTQTLSRPAVAITAGGAHSCALLDDGTATCWGQNETGQLGDATTTNRSTPAPFALPAGRIARAISGGWRHTCAVLDDGSVVCSGDNLYGQLGDTTTTLRTSPAAVPLPTGRRAQAVSAGLAHSCAILDDGSAVCWGGNYYGQIGNGAIGDPVAPTVVALPQGRTAITIAAGEGHTCAVLDDGTARCWGFNAFGQTGDGTTDGVGMAIARPTPVPVNLPGRRLTAISAGERQTCALVADGAATCWGRNLNAQLGDGTTTDRPDPQAVSPALSPGSVPGTVADLSVRIVEAPAQLAVGSTGRVAVRISNDGPDPASGVGVTLTGALVDLSAATSSSGALSSSIWQPAALVPGGSATLTLDTTARAVGRGTVSAEITTARDIDPDSTPGNEAVGEDDRATASISIGTTSAPGTPTVTGSRPSGSPTMSRRRATRLTLVVERVGRRVTVRGVLAIPTSAACRGSVRVTARTGTATRVVRRPLRRVRGVCRYQGRILMPLSSVNRVGARFTGTVAIFPITSKVRRA